MKINIEIDTNWWKSNAVIREWRVWLIAARNALSAVGPAMRRELAGHREEASFAEAFATTPLLKWDRIKGFTRGGKKVSDEEINSDPDYAHFVQCRDSAPKLDNRYH